MESLTSSPNKQLQNNGNNNNLNHKQKKVSLDLQKNKTFQKRKNSSLLSTNQQQQLLQTQQQKSKKVFMEDEFQQIKTQKMKFQENEQYFNIDDDDDEDYQEEYQKNTNNKNQNQNDNISVEQQKQIYEQIQQQSQQQQAFVTGKNEISLEDQAQIYAQMESVQQIQQQQQQKNQNNQDEQMEEEEEKSQISNSDIIKSQLQQLVYRTDHINQDNFKIKLKIIYQSSSSFWTIQKIVEEMNLIYDKKYAQELQEIEQNSRAVKKQQPIKNQFYQKNNKSQQYGALQVVQNQTQQNNIMQKNFQNNFQDSDDDDDFEDEQDLECDTEEDEEECKKTEISKRESMEKNKHQGYYEAQQNMMQIMGSAFEDIKDPNSFIQQQQNQLQKFQQQQQQSLQNSSIINNQNNFNNNINIITKQQQHQQYNYNGPRFNLKEIMKQLNFGNSQNSKFKKVMHGNLTGNQAIFQQNSEQGDEEREEDGGCSTGMMTCDSLYGDGGNNSVIQDDLQDLI